MIDINLRKLFYRNRLSITLRHYTAVSKQT